MPGGAQNRAFASTSDIDSDSDGPLGKVSAVARRWPLSIAAAVIVAGVAGVVAWCTYGGPLDGGAAAGYDACADGDVVADRDEPHTRVWRDRGRHYRAKPPSRAMIGDRPAETWPSYSQTV